MNGHLVSYEPAKKLNVFDSRFSFFEDGTESHVFHKELGLLHDDGTYPMLTPSVVNFLPGMEVLDYSESVGGHYLRKKGALYINDVHFGPNPIDQYDSSWFNIYYRPTPPKRQLKEIIMGTLGIAPIKPALIIPANEIKKFTTELRISETISMVTVVPHMHLLGKYFQAYAITPANDTIPIIRIKNWDFRWQYAYTFPQLLPIPAGSLIKAEGVFDNTEKNANNPFFPPQLIMERNGSMRTTDEMFQLIFTYVNYQNGDEKISLEP